MLIKKRWHLGVLIITVALVAGGLLSYTFVKNGYFPVAKVGGKYISYKAVKENMNVSKKIYENGLAGYSEEMEILFKRGNERLLFGNALDSIITNEIIRSVVGKEIISKAEEEINKNFNEKNISNMASAIKEIYGWNMIKFREKILEPQAILDVLMEEKGDGFSDWIESEKKKADVKIWFIPFVWSEGELINK